MNTSKSYVSGFEFDPIGKTPSSMGILRQVSQTAGIPFRIWSVSTKLPPFQYKASRTIQYPPNISNTSLLVNKICLFLSSFFILSRLLPGFASDVANDIGASNLRMISLLLAEGPVPYLPLVGILALSDWLALPLDPPPFSALQPPTQVGSALSTARYRSQQAVFAYPR